MKSCRSYTLPNFKAFCGNSCWDVWVWRLILEDKHLLNCLGVALEFKTPKAKPWVTGMFQDVSVWTARLVSFFPQNELKILPGTVLFYTVWFGTRTKSSGKGHKVKHRRCCQTTRKTLCYCEGDPALAQVAQRGCGVSLLQHTQKPSRQDSGQLTLGGPAWAWRLDQMPTRHPFQPWLCYDSVICMYIVD